MLGRQQIAGIPTAISELFKNAHDAYAENVVANYLRPANLFVLRDDGVGMTESEFTDKWLTLGTESKLGDSPPLSPPPQMPVRPVLGEKGIGRLAIAAIGPQVLVLTKSRNPGARGVAAFFNWRFFEIPRLNLDDIAIPLETFSRRELPDASFVARLVAAARSTAQALRAKTPSDLYEQIMMDLAQFKVDPSSLAGVLSAPNLAASAGTQFYISPVNETLASDIDDTPTDTAPKLITTLLGFTNTMTPRHSKAVIKTAFYDHKSETLVEDLIEPGEFFTSTEFNSADHHISGLFDEFGTFNGTIKIYGSHPERTTIPWRSGKLSGTKCGPFSIKVAVVQGSERHTKMSAERWNPLTRKMDKLGGLYIYDDNVRVLPYGNADYDFLEIERNRTKSAGYYYFSYRRLFGIVELSRIKNVGLREKAGREGFIENAAYRQFRDILMNFFVVVAGEFFREKGEHAEEWLEARSELERAFKAKQELDRERKVQRQQLRGNLDDLFGRLEAGEPASRVETLIADVRRQLEAAQRKGPAVAAGLIPSIEADAYRRLDDLRNLYRLEVPRGFGKDRNLQFDIDAYYDEFRTLEARVFDPSIDRLQGLISNHLKRADAKSNERQRVAQALKIAAVRAGKLIEDDQNDVVVQLNQLSTRLQNLTQTYRARLETEFKTIEAELSAKPKAAANGGIGISQAKYGRRLDEVALSGHQALAELRTQISQLGVGIEADRPSQLAVYEAMETELLELRSRSEDDLELAQLGMAVRVINHEFDSTIRAIRAGLRELRPWASANRKLDPLYRRLVAHFNHLDAYLALFTPLQRRLYRSETTMVGNEIFKFLTDLFSEAFEKSEIAFTATTEFRQYRFAGYPSTFYPVFVNVIDNARFWLERHRGARIIQLDSRGESMLISNTGPAIPERDRVRIFEYGFSRKPSGQGLGLFISRQVLRKEGFDLSVRSSTEFPAVFVIERMTKP